MLLQLWYKIRECIQLLLSSIRLLYKFSLLTLQSSEQHKHCRMTNLTSKERVSCEVLNVRKIYYRAGYGMLVRVNQVWIVTSLLWNIKHVLFLQKFYSRTMVMINIFIIYRLHYIKKLPFFILKARWFVYTLTFDSEL